MDSSMNITWKSIFIRFPVFLPSLCFICWALLHTANFDEKEFYQQLQYEEHRKNILNTSLYNKIELVANPFNQPWPDDEHCRRFETHFAYFIRRTILLSFPRSGNSWLRYLIEGSTGIFTGSFYNDTLHYYDKGFLGEIEEPQSTRVIVTKTHWNKKLFRNKDDRMILLIRCPGSAIVSLYKWYKFEKEKEPQNKILHHSDYNSKDFNIFFRDQLAHWYKTLQFAIENVNKLHVIQYENLIQNTSQEVQRFLHFLNIEPTRKRLQCLNQHLNGPFKATKTLSLQLNKAKKIAQMKTIAKANALLMSRKFQTITCKGM